MQIRTRITIQFVVVVTLLIAASFSIIYYSSSTYRQSEFYDRLNHKVETSLEIYSSVNKKDSTILRIFDRKQKDKLRYEKVVIYDENFKQLFSSNDSILVEHPKAFLTKLKSNERLNGNFGLYESTGLKFVDSDTGQVLYGVVSAFDLFGYSKLNNLKNTLIFLFFALITISGITGWFYAKRALNPLSILVTEIENLDVDKLDKKLSETNNRDEIGRLVLEFNDLLRRIENSVNIQKLFISGASHELKNPLTAITSQLQVNLMKDRSVDEYKSVVKSVLEDIKNLNQTANELIEFARLSSENDINAQPIRIDDVLWEACDEIHKRFPTYTIGLQFDAMPENEKEITIPGNASLLKIAFINLVDNACKFSNDNACKISFSTQPGKIIVAVTDHGIGLSEQEKQYVFEPFYRANSTSAIRGHGIGLALTKRIIELHNGYIQVQSQMGVGSEFILFFKVVQ